jgi:transcriptional regulator with XRE-family HTH domain
MDVTEELWKEQLQRLGDYIKAQRKFNQQSQRELARVADLSDTYMSQLERGLHEPSIRVLRSVAEGLGIRPSQLIMYAAGLPVEDGDVVSTEDAIRRDERLTPAQRDALLGVLRSYIDSNQPD